MTSVERPEWTIQAPAGGWATPWPQAAELANAIPSEQWTLIGGADGAVARSESRSATQPTDP